MSRTDRVLRHRPEMVVAAVSTQEIEEEDLEKESEETEEEEMEEDEETEDSRKREEDMVEEEMEGARKRKEEREDARKQEEEVEASLPGGPKPRPSHVRRDACMSYILTASRDKPVAAMETSSVAPALITCLRWRGFTSECAREGAARHDLLRRHRGSSSTCLRRRPPPVCGLLNHQAFQLQWPARRRQLWILPDRTRRCSRTVLAALVVDLVPARNDTRRAALPPSDVPPHAGSPFARCHNATRRC